jgi:hypothetical protein
LKGEYVVIAQPQSSREYDSSGVAESIDRDGFAVIECFIPPEEIAHARMAIEAAVRENGNESVGRVGSLDRFEDTFVHRLTHDPAFNALCREICTASLGREAPGSDIMPSLRCLSGRSGAQQSMFFHYDSFVLAALVPIIIPDGEQRGRLIVYPNRRGVRRSYLTNFVDKLWTDSKAAQRRYHGMYAAGNDRLRFIDMVPGNLYLFWGYRSIHTNEACNPDRIRSTAIFHYYDPHANSALKKLFRLRYALRPAIERMTRPQAA